MLLNVEVQVWLNELHTTIKSTISAMMSNALSEMSSAPLEDLAYKVWPRWRHICPTRLYSILQAVNTLLCSLSSEH